MKTKSTENGVTKNKQRLLNEDKKKPENGVTKKKQRLLNEDKKNQRTESRKQLDRKVVDIGCLNALLEASTWHDVRLNGSCYDCHVFLKDAPEAG